MHFDARPGAATLLATLVFCVLSTVVFGLGPALRLSRTDLVEAMKQAVGAGRAPRRRGPWSGRNVLVGAQLALSLGLLTTAGLFLRGAVNASRADPGYPLEQRLLVSVDGSLAGYGESRARAVYGQLTDRLRALPGVAAASPASLVAFGVLSESRGVRPAGEAGRNRDARAVFASIGADYFRTAGLTLLRGRDFTTSEEREGLGPPTAIIDVPLARALFGDEDPVGRLVELDDGDAGRRVPRLVVGLAPGLRQSLWDKAPVGHVYVPTGQVYRAALYYHVRLANGASQAQALQAIRREVRAVDGRLPVLALQSLTEHRDSTTTYWAVRALAVIFSLFGGLALFLAVVGVYAVNAYVVAGRTRELGIRMALGSTPGGAVRLVLGDGLRLAAGGVVVGLAIAAAIGRVVGNVLFEVSPFDPLVFGVTPLVLAAAAFTASYLPARRATRIPPVVALRTE